MDGDKLGLTLRESLRYGYGGFLLALVAALVVPSQAQNLVAILGPVLTPLAALSAGALLYAFTRVLVVNWIADPFAYGIHCLLDLGYGFVRRTPDRISCARWYVEKTFSVRHRYSLNAIRVIRDSNEFRDKVRDALHVQNSETHMLFMTAAVLGVAAWLLDSDFLPPVANQGTLATVFLWLAPVFTVVAFGASLSVSGQLCAQIRTLDHATIRDMLGDHPQVAKKKAA